MKPNPTHRKAFSFALIPFFFSSLFEGGAFENRVLEVVQNTLNDAPELAQPLSSSGCYESTPAVLASKSSGLPWQGSLEDGVFLNESTNVRHVDAQRCAFWGTRRLVQMVERTAARVAQTAPGARLTVGELSLPEGGDIVGHSSHENGRDIDLGFYFVDDAGEPAEPGRLVDVRRDGTARWQGQTLHFDVARNWKLLESLLLDPEADLQLALINARIRTMLLNEAQRQDVSRDMLVRAARVMVVPRRGEHPHLNHFHVRIFCPEGTTECRDGRELWEWTVAARQERARHAAATPGAPTHS